MTVSENRNSTLRRRFGRIRRSVEGALGIGFYLVALVLIVIACWAAYANVVKSGWSSDAASWVQGAGSIAAIVGATWLAQSEARRSRRVRRQQNEEAAWYVRYVIKQAQFESQIIAAELVHRTSPVSDDEIRDWQQRAATSAISINAFINKIDHAHPGITHMLANAKTLIDILIQNLDAAACHVKENENIEQRLIERIVSPHAALNDLLDQYDSRMRGIQLALDEGGDALPIKDWLKSI